MNTQTRSAGTALGPVLYASVFDSIGSYSPVLLATIALPAGVSVAALLTRLPAHAVRR